MYHAIHITNRERGTCSASLEVVRVLIRLGSALSSMRVKDRCPQTIVEAVILQLDKRYRPCIKPTNGAYRVDETCYQGQRRRDLSCRAVNSMGNTIEFMLIENRDVKSAERFIEKALKSPHGADPKVTLIRVNKSVIDMPIFLAPGSD